MSGGVHRLWKQTLIEEIGLLKPQYPIKQQNEGKSQKVNILDVAAGSGDISFKLIDYQKEHSNNPFKLHERYQFTLSDINADMLEQAKINA